MLKILTLPLRILVSCVLAVVLVIAGANLGEVCVSQGSIRDVEEAVALAQADTPLQELGLPGSYAPGETHSTGLFTAAESGYPYDCIVVLGASVLPDGSPSDILRSRLDAAIALYEAGYAPILVMSGNGKDEGYDEPAAMKAYAISQGVPASAIYCDRGGLHSYDTLWRAAHVFEAEHVVVVTQQYHLYRCVCDAKGVGLDVLGVVADSDAYNDQLFYEVREVGARVNDLWQIVTGTTPPDASTEITLE